MDEKDVVNRKVWSQELLKNVMLYPNEKIVAFLGRNYKDRQSNMAKNALDVGFGSGRHLKLLSEYGFNVSGIDYSEVSLQTAKDLFGEHPLVQNLSVQSIEDLTADNNYSVIIAYGVIFLREIELIKRDLVKLYGLLEKGGKMIVNFRTTEDALYKRGKHISGKSYILDNSVPAYQDMLYTFFDLEEAKQLLEEVGFLVTNIEREDYWKNNLTERHSWWIFTVEKM